MATILMTRLVSSPEYGNCMPGSLVKNCSDSFAEHCVVTLQSAVYYETKQIEKPKKRRQGRKKLNETKK